MTAGADPGGARSFTLVSFHAHPDDEALLTGGTLARAVAEGHRVVLVVATAGEAGLASDVGDLGARRSAELAESAAALGVHRVEVLGYPDSGYDARVAEGPDGLPPFAATEPAEVAQRLAGILRQERADALTSYDINGGYGHADHVQVHRVAALAAQLAGTPVLLEATLDRRLFASGLTGLRVLRRVAGRLLPLPLLPSGGSLYTAHDELTHCVDVRGQLTPKRRALAAHASQTGGPGTGSRTLTWLLRLPAPIFRRVVGREWFREVGRSPGGPLLDDIFASLR